MVRYIIGRAGQGLISLFVMSVLIFVMSRAPADAAFVLLPDDALPGQLEQIKHDLKLDLPLHEQYVYWLWNALHGDLGHSTSRPALSVTDIIKQRLPNTMVLAGTGFLLSTTIGISVGIFAAVQHGKPIDLFARLFAILGQSAPGFWVGVMLIILFAVILGWLPAGGMGGPNTIILPALTLGWAASASKMRLTRSAMLEVLDSEYIKLARIKGVREGIVIWKHALKNAALPIVTFLGLALVGLITGAIIAETIFAWPGVGRMMYQAILSRDFPVIQGGVLMITTAYVTTNLMVDIAYAFLNPRIRFGT